MLRLSHSFSSPAPVLFTCLSRIASLFCPSSLHRYVTPVLICVREKCNNEVQLGGWTDGRGRSVSGLSVSLTSILHVDARQYHSCLISAPVSVRLRLSLRFSPSPSPRPRPRRHRRCRRCSDGSSRGAEYWAAAYSAVTQRPRGSRTALRSRCVRSRRRECLASVRRDSSICDS